jgi:PDZ domain-containing protein
MNKLKQFIKEEKWFILILIIIIFLYNYHLPYYIDTPGGTININDRIECDSCSDINGDLNMLYVSEYEATIPMYLLSYVIPNWDLEKISDQQVNNETTEEIYERNKLMLNNSIDNATYVAYKEAGKKIEVKSKKTVVIATTLNNNLKIGDEVLEVDGKKIEDANDIKEIIKNKEVNSKLDFKISRNDKVENVKVVIKEQDKTKIIGVVIITDYDYDITPQIDIKFKSKETGSSGGLMMALSIYSKISGEDIVKGRKIAGTGTIDIDGTVGEIDGIKYKIMGAVKNKMDVVIVPKDNYKEAIKVKKDNNYDIEIVSVNTFEDAIKYLKKTK